MKNLCLTIILLILTGMLLEVWKIGQPAAREWDESRRGINAVSMMNNGDYFHYYYLDQPDSFNTKPPLAVWLIILKKMYLGEKLPDLRNIISLKMRIDSLLFPVT